MNPEGPLELPWLLPGIAIAFVVSIALSGAVARALHVHRLLAWLLIMSLAVIASATLTPQWEALAFGAQGSSTCNLSRFGLAPLDELLAVNETSLNVLLLIPLGVAIALLPSSRTKVVLVVVAIALPFAIETTQLLVPVLDRGCESADVIDNLTGLVIGFVAGVVAGFVAGWVARLRR